MIMVPTVVASMTDPRSPLNGIRVEGLKTQRDRHVTDEVDSAQPSIRAGIGFSVMLDARVYKARRHFTAPPENAGTAEPGTLTC